MIQFAKKFENNRYSVDTLVKRRVLPGSFNFHYKMTNLGCIFQEDKLEDLFLYIDETVIRPSPLPLKDLKFKLIDLPKFILPPRHRTQIERLTTFNLRLVSRGQKQIAIYRFLKNKCETVTLTEDVFRNPAKHLRGSVLQKQLTARICYLFLQNTPSQMIDIFLNMPL